MSVEPSREDRHKQARYDAQNRAALAERRLREANAALREAADFIEAVPGWRGRTVLRDRVLTTLAAAHAPTDMPA